MDLRVAVAFVSCLGGCFVDLGGEAPASADGSAATSESTADPGTGGPGSTNGDDAGETAATTTAMAPTTGGPGTGLTTDGTAGCGNEVVEGDEECDDGNAQSGDGCTAECRLEGGCGDGSVDDAEGCDDGNQQDGDGCSATCTLEGCGDGVKLASEQCDDGNLEPEDGCSDKCELKFLYVFVTTNVYTGALGGVAGADERCNEEVGGKLPGTYRAWIATSEADRPAVRFSTFGGTPYRLPDRLTTIVGGFAGFNNDIQHPIDQTADGVTIVTQAGMCDTDRFVWTGLDEGGNAVPDEHCDGWMSSDGAYYGRSGDVTAMNQLWTSACISNCDRALRLYCVQQAP